MGWGRRRKRLWRVNSANYKNMESFIKNEKILEEDYKCDDLLGFSEIINNFKERLNQIKENSIIGLIGRFGSGKSTMLYQLYKERKEDNDGKWINFDAWKYPERKELWEGFVLDIADQIGCQKKINNKLKGKNTKSKILDIATDFLSELTDRLPNFNFLDKFSEIFKKSPATKVFEIQKILFDLIKQCNKNFYIIIEDIDRSGDRGIFFIETLRNFIKENKFDKKIIVIVPIGEKKRQEDNFKDSYNKVLDYDIYFKPENIDFSKFIKEVFDDQFASENYLLEYHLNYLFRLLVQYKNITIRELKGILRLAHLEYKKLKNEEKHKINIIVWIVFAQIYKCNENILALINNKQRIKNDFWAKRLFIMLGANIKEDQLKNYKDMPIFIDQNNFMTPKFQEDIFQKELIGCYLSDKYLKYFQ
jgi:energy-coupling factor transporter ATP-binding protein EcfA2